MKIDNFLEGISPKINVILRMEFELTYEKHTISFQTFLYSHLKLV